MFSILLYSEKYCDLCMVHTTRRPILLLEKPPNAAFGTQKPTLITTSNNIPNEYIWKIAHSSMSSLLCHIYSNSARVLLVIHHFVSVRTSGAHAPLQGGYMAQ